MKSRKKSKAVKKLASNLKQRLEGTGFNPEEMLIADGHDNAIIGVVEQFGRPPTVCYNLEQVLKNLMKMGMNADEAREYWEYNMIGAWVGDSTPVYMTKI